MISSIVMSWSFPVKSGTGSSRFDSELFFCYVELLLFDANSVEFGFVAGLAVAGGSGREI